MSDEPTQAEPAAGHRPSATRPSNVVFDFGKVLFDWEPEALVTRLLPEHAVDGPATQALVGNIFEGFGGDWGEFDRGVLAATELAERISRRTGLSIAQARSVIDAVPHELQPMAGMPQLLERLHRAGHRLYFLSNMPLPYADHLEATHDFLRWFRGGVFSGRVRLIKPEPAIYRYASEVFGIAAADTVFIDDVQRNVVAARAHGWHAIHFQSPAQCQAEMVSLGVL